MRNPHLKEQAVEIHIPESKASGYAILCLHGRNQTPAFMQEILKQLEWKDLPTILPIAADKSWYPKGFMVPLEENQPNFDFALETVSHYHKRLNKLGFKNEQIILMGFSQGACLISQYALMNPDLYKGIVVFTGGYIGQEGIDWKFNGDFKQSPVYISISEIDEWVPVGRTKETAFEFEKLNAEVKLDIFKTRPHEVSLEEIKASSELFSL